MTGFETGLAADSVSFRERIHPQLRRQLDRMLEAIGPQGFGGIDDLNARRPCYEQVMSLATRRAPDASRVERRPATIGVSACGSPLTIRSYHPVGIGANVPGILYVHGGGFVMGSIAAEDGSAAALAENVGCVVVSVGYGLAPENSGECPVNDVYQALTWIAEHAEPLGIDPERLAVFGSSAGGGLACGASLLSRDRGGPRLAYQMLIYPMLDDRQLTASSQTDLALYIWEPANNAEAWRHLLGDDVGAACVSPYAAPARAQHLAGLPPTYIEIGELDIFLDEARQMARRLSESGVPVEWHEFGGAYHGYDQLAPSSDISKVAHQYRIEALRRALDLAPPEGQENSDS